MLENVVVRRLQPEEESILSVEAFDVCLAEICRIVGDSRRNLLVVADIAALAVAYDIALDYHGLVNRHILAAATKSADLCEGHGLTDAVVLSLLDNVEGLAILGAEAVGVADFQRSCAEVIRRILRAGDADATLSHSRRSNPVCRLTGVAYLAEYVLPFGNIGSVGDAELAVLVAVEKFGRALERKLRHALAVLLNKDCVRAGRCLHDELHHTGIVTVLVALYAEGAVAVERYLAAYLPRVKVADTHPVNLGVGIAQDTFLIGVDVDYLLEFGHRLPVLVFGLGRELNLGLGDAEFHKVELFPVYRGAGSKSPHHPSDNGYSYD